MPSGESTHGAITALCEAFADYPVMRYVLGDVGDYAERLRTLIGFFVAARVLRRDAILTVSTGSELGGVALCTLPGLASPPALQEIREKTWAALGADARGRYDQCIRAWEPLAVAEPNIHVNMLAVPPRFQGRGLGRALLDRVHAMSGEHPDSRGVTLTTERRVLPAPGLPHRGSRPDRARARDLGVLPPRLRTAVSR